MSRSIAILMVLAVVAAGCSLDGSPGADAAVPDGAVPDAGARDAGEPIDAAEPDAATDGGLVECVPMIELCNGRDDDCDEDGARDETFPCVQSEETSCTTMCGSIGTGICSASCELPAPPACTAPAETCNGDDDDCDGLSDESLFADATSLVPLGPGRSGVRLLATEAGYDAFWLNGAAILAQHLDPGGAPTGTAVTIIASGVAGYNFDVVRSDDHATYSVVAFSSDSAILLARVSAATFAVDLPAAALFGVTGVPRAIRLARATATDWVMYVTSTDASGTVVLQRHLWQAGALHTRLIEAVHPSASFFDVVRDSASGIEYVAYVRPGTGGVWEVEAREIIPTATSAGVGPRVPVATVSNADARYVVLAGRGSGPPTGVAWGEAGLLLRLRFARMETVPNWHVAYATTIDSVRIAVPNDPSDADAEELVELGGRFFLFADIEATTGFNSLHAYEIIPGGIDAVVRRLAIPTAEVPYTLRHGLAAVGAHDRTAVRALAETSDGSLATVGLGCP